MSEAGKVVCVTGAAGYVASWLVKLLLQRGYTVKATVRNLSDPKKFVHLKEFEGANERLHLFEASLLEDGSFDSVVVGCDGVFHTASPVVSTDAITDVERDLLDPAVKGTLNVLKSCSKVTSVRRVVLTSSMASVLKNRNPIGPDVVMDEMWFSDADFCRETEQWYFLSKTLAEEAAWKFAKENGIDLVTMNPGLIIGPLLQPTLNLTSELIVAVVKGKEVLPVYDTVDVRDVGKAHILAFENPSANGRYLLVGSMTSLSQVQEILHKIFPSLNYPNNASKEPIVFQVSKKKAESLGVDFTPFEVSLKDIVESLKEKNFLSF